MTKIIYRKRYNALPDEEGALILKEVSGVGTKEVEISLTEMPAGYVTVYDLTAKTVGGIARLDLSSLPDGLYTPIFVTGSRALLCSPIIKRHDVIIRPLPDGSDISRLELLISRQEEKIATLERELSRIRTLTEGKSLEI